jgi:hypothetical protein
MEANSERLFKAKFSVAFYFEMVGFILGNWVARIPAVKSGHHLSDGLFGVVLVVSIFGACLCLPVISPIISKFGSIVGVLFG